MYLELDESYDSHCVSQLYIKKLDHKVMDIDNLGNIEIGGRGRGKITDRTSDLVVSIGNKL
jgi:hypothetical protein